MIIIDSIDSTRLRLDYFCLFLRRAAVSSIWCCTFWLLGNSYSFALAGSPITGAQAVAQMREILGDPTTFVQILKEDVEVFIKDHFGSLAIAAAFSLAMRKMAI